MEMMDRELASTKAGDSLVRPADQGSPRGSKADVELDTNLAKNILDSIKSQEGTSGPVSNILGRLGVFLPPDRDDDDTED
jgi:hypothetical protein